MRQPGRTRPRERGPGLAGRDRNGDTHARRGGGRDRKGRDRDLRRRGGCGRSRGGGGCRRGPHPRGGGGRDRRGRLGGRGRGTAGTRGAAGSAGGGTDGGTATDAGGGAGEGTRLLLSAGEFNRDENMPKRNMCVSVFLLLSRVDSTGTRGVGKRVEGFFK